MATVSTPEISATPAPVSSRGQPRIVISEQVSIPSDIVDLESFCLWRCSDEAPEKLKISYLGGTIWVDVTMEAMYTHNQVKAEISRVLGNLVREMVQGLFLVDGMLLRNDAADLSTEPDGCYVSYRALETGRAQRHTERLPDVYQLDGSPEMTLEVVSSSSVRKDTVDLRDRYYKAGILEYWLVDARSTSELQFDILRHGANGYTKIRRQAGGWLRSNVFGKSFRLSQTSDPLGDPLYTLEVR